MSQAPPPGPLAHRAAARCAGALLFVLPAARCAGALLFVLPAARCAGALLFVLAAAQYGWNAWNVPPLTGYDAPAHAGYALSILREGGLPHPYQGWSTFHPPLYYLLASGVWALVEPLGPRAVVAALRGIGGAALLGAGWVTWRLLRRRGAPWPVAWVATALVLFAPVSQLAAAMVGNEALAAGLSALALPWLLALQRDPRDARTAALAALCAGLALATKYSGLFVAVACAVPFLRRDFDRPMARALAAALVVGAVVAGPVYVRNVALTGVPNPILRTREPTRSTEEANIIRPRRVTDYLWIDPACLRRPSVHHLPPGVAAGEPPRNPHMTNVWGLTYASLWYDAFAHRIPKRFHRDGVPAGPLLAALGVVPTGVMLLGFGLALAECARRRGRCDDAPLVAVWLAGLGSFVAFTAWAQSVVAVKASYLLPLTVPGALFYARGVARLGARLRIAVVALSALAALAAALVFSEGLLFPSLDRQLMAGRWRLVGQVLGESHISEAVDRLVGRP